MKVLLDHDLPAQLRLLLKGHLALTARAMRWDALSNGRLLAAAEANAFDVLLTGDQKLIYQQNNAERRIALVVLSGTDLRTVLAHYKLALDAIERSTPGSFEFVRLFGKIGELRAIE